MEKARILVILYNNVKPSNYYYNPLMGKRNGVLNMKKVLSFGIALTVLAVGISFGVSTMNKNLAELPPIYKPNSVQLAELPPIYKSNFLQLAGDVTITRELPPIY